MSLKVLVTRLGTASMAGLALKWHMLLVAAMLRCLVCFLGTVLCLSMAMAWLVLVRCTVVDRFVRLVLMMIIRLAGLAMACGA